MGRWLLVFVALLALGFAQFAFPGTRAQADEGCSASWTDLGQSEGLDSAWFNVFGENFDESVLPELTFDVPVIPYPLEGTSDNLPAVTTFTLPGELMNSDVFKMTFRANDPATKEIAVTISGKAIRGGECQASTTVELDSNAPYTPEPQSCIGDYTLLTKGDGSAEAPFVPTIWFNVFDDIGFRGDSDVVLTFDVPVIPYPPLDDPSAILPAVTTYTMPPNSKATFRTRDQGVETVTVKMQTVSPGCATTMVVNLDPNAPSTPYPTLPPTATVEAAAAPDELPVVPILIALAAGSGVVIARRAFTARR